MRGCGGWLLVIGYYVVQERITSFYVWLVYEFIRRRGGVMIRISLLLGRSVNRRPAPNSFGA